VLYEIEELSSPEIAALLQIPLGSVASRLRRARKEFRAVVKGIERAMRREGTHEPRDFEPAGRLRAGGATDLERRLLDAVAHEQARPRSASVWPRAGRVDRGLGAAPAEPRPAPALQHPRRLRAWARDPRPSCRGSPSVFSAWCCRRCRGHACMEGFRSRATCPVQQWFASAVRQHLLRQRRLRRHPYRRPSAIIRTTVGRDHGTPSHHVRVATPRRGWGAGEGVGGGGGGRGAGGGGVGRGGGVERRMCVGVGRGGC